MKKRVFSVLGASFVLAVGAATSPPVQVSLRSSWPAPPFLVEIIETVSLENPDAFFPLLDLLTDENVLPYPNKMTPEAMKQAALQVASSNGLLAEPGALALIEMNLALHAATPKIEAFYHHYEGHHHNGDGRKCGSWVDWYGEVVCDLQILAKRTGVETIDATHANASAITAYSRPTILSFDHIYPSLSQNLKTPARTAILYASLTSPNFRELHSHLLSLAAQSEPHMSMCCGPPSRNYLSGYGVVLDLKKMDYLALDDRHSQEAWRSIILEAREEKRPTTHEAGSPLTEEELLGIGTQVTQLISDSSKPLEALTLIAQNFPKYAANIARRVQEIHSNSLKAQGGMNVLWLNGATVSDKDASPFGIIMQSLTSLGLSREDGIKLLTHKSISVAQSNADALDGIFDATDRPEDGGIVTYWNDIETDSRSPFPSVKLNLFNIIIVADLSQISSLNFIAGPMANIIDRNFPLVQGIRMARLFYHLIQTFGRKKTMEFLQKIAQSSIPPEMRTSTVSWESVRSEFVELNEAEGSGETGSVNLDAILDGSTSSAPLDKIRIYTERLGATTFFYDQPTSSKRRNRFVYPSSAADLRLFNLPDVFARIGFWSQFNSFLYPGDSVVTPISIYLVADLNSDAGIAFVREALQSMDSQSRTRFSFVHNPLPVTGESINRMSNSWLVSHLISSWPAFSTGALELTSGLRIAAGQEAIIINGRVVGPIPSGEFLSADFKTLENYEMHKRAQPVVDALEDIIPSIDVLERETLSNMISMSSAIVAAIQQPDRRPRQRNYQLLDDEYTGFEFGDNSTALYHFATSQKWSSLLNWISNIPDVYIQVYVNPARYSEMPLKRFYRYNLLPKLQFDEEGLEIPAQAIFEDLPSEPIYTLAMDVPSSWLVRPREALYDLDNIQLNSITPEDSGVDAVFELDYLVIEGHARETATNAPPRGLQLQLINSDLSPIDDTQVVANLGYIQFKAKPGVFQLEIREGRGRDVFVMESVGNEGWDSPTVDIVGSEITLTSFEGLTLYPRLSRVSGMETVDVLEEPSTSTNMNSVVQHVTSWFKQMFQSADTAPPEASLVKSNEQADINIFTVASGLLYERFVSIMILSVLRNTKSTVKFWFIENFLSPSFLEFIPHMAETYGFQYELVTYKWPSWLRAQKEKQRIIWAYKILFLDVLFPMDLKKVIFVDADQIVRADLQELVDLDIHGAPYAYTPMGDDNTEMEGFRFWKTGYWEEFLKGLPYHISALYVIDLVRFRQDMLRGQYQQLSADPNSLANLDQDLPNNLQREVPIYSLPEDWLWVRDHLL
ncbi:UDP-glucose:glycoprotein glucosyltransferase-domain-containing protein [Infundibulicybe gibba]|nr:UDP-glucose:glycoprotein glucosyltransferase-domain-containing protein [Infundibulicybe gibba]